MGVGCPLLAYFDCTGWAGKTGMSHRDQDCRVFCPGAVRARLVVVWVEERGISLFGCHSYTSFIYFLNLLLFT